MAAGVLLRGAEFVAALLSKTERFPDEEDLSGAATALLRLQDTYALQTERLVRGELEGAKHSPPMTGLEHLTLVIGYKHLPLVIG